MTTLNVIIHTMVEFVKQAVASANDSRAMDLVKNTTDNITEVVSEDKSKGYVGMIVLMFILALLFNISALIMIIKSSKSHKWSAFYRLMVSLNITDLFGSITSFPVLLATYANNVEFQGGQQVCDYNGYMISFVFLASASIVGTMSTERFIGVWFPFFYNSSEAKEKRTNVILGTIWVTVAFIALLPIIGFGEYVLQYPGTWCFYNFRATNLRDKVYAYLYSVIWILIILCTIIFNVLVIVKLTLRRINATDRKKQNGKANRNEIYSIILLVVIVIVTATCGIPLAIRAIVNESGSMKDNNADLHASRMASFNMILDPLVYIFFRRENLECLFRFIRKRRGKSEKSSEECSSTSAKTDNTTRSATNLENIDSQSSDANRY
ncbi:prostaglandin E2 receptor EP4 subtype-like [Saccostrea cucullata]|uniref:prostaglandin E2 receptor EP4 subtype-like n=1 Tax=Saccostrea cuccullata TaxID=36930 RepID=UPI002ED38E16